MRKEFNFDALQNCRIAIHCSTKEESKDFTERCCEKRFTWGSTELPDWNYWKEQTCYSSKKDKKIYCTNIDYYKKYGYTILEWSDYMEKEFTIEDLKSGYVVELADRGKCLVVEDSFGLSLYNVEALLRIASTSKKHIRLKQGVDVWSYYNISKVYGYKENDFSQNTIDGRELLWEYKEPKPITLKCETENYSIVKNDKNTIIESKNNKVSVSISNNAMKELLPIVQKLFRMTKTVAPTIDDSVLFRTRNVNKFEKGDTVMVDGQNDCRGERGTVLNCTDKYVTVFLSSAYITDFSPKVLTKINK